jgi:hypothetical protein
LFDFHFAFILFRYTAPVEGDLIEPARFCSQCGEALNARRARFVWLRASCADCAPRLRVRRFLRTASLALLIIFSFALGRYATTPRTVYLLGTPIEPLATVEGSEVSRASTSYIKHAAEAAGLTDETVSICGAPTKSGKPCQRKVKGGGYCYQHRDKNGPKNTNRHSQ